LWWILDYLKSSHIFDVVANLQNAQCCLSGCSMAFTVQLEGRFRAEAAERALEAVERRGLCAILYAVALYSAQIFVGAWLGERFIGEGSRSSGWRSACWLSGPPE
jgi:hypothetical protein